MPTIDRYHIDFKEMTELLIRHSSVHEGHWGIFIEFGLGAANVNVAPPPEERVLPAAIVPVQKIGIQRFDQPNPLTLDAAVVNPVQQAPTPKEDLPLRKLKLGGKRAEMKPSQQEKE